MILCTGVVWTLSYSIAELLSSDMSQQTSQLYGIFHATWSISLKYSYLDLPTIAKNQIVYSMTHNTLQTFLWSRLHQEQYLHDVHWTLLYCFVL